MQKGAQRLSASQRGAFFHPFVTLYQWACAQRLSASQRGACLQLELAESPALACSTPFGITEGGIGRPGPGYARMERCSTPFGITEGGMTTRASRRPIRGCAQRLSASQRGAYQQVGRSRRRDRVLNAFRHHRGGHERHHDGRRRAPKGAQRLSASQRGAFEPVGGVCDPERVLNAFRHHRGGHEIGGAARPSPIECSTPFGITEGGM